MDSLTTIQNKILDIRGQKVILDRDLALMYGVENRVLNQAVKRNIERFPNDFMFQLDTQEFENWKSQTVISNSDKMGLRKRPFAFTELGVAMLSSILKSPTAIQINISIMRAFVMMRQMVTNAKNAPVAQLEQKIDKLAMYVEDVLKDQNDINEDMQMQLDNISEVIAELQASKALSNKPRKRIGFYTQTTEFNDNEKQNNSNVQ